ncbi:MAG: hypothetical protein R3Y21_05515 [Mycoplasmatota bacterium]
MKNIKLDSNDEEKQIALLKFSIIAPLVNSLHTANSKMAFFREVASTEYTMPNGKKVYFAPSTIKHWYATYCKYGFDSLISKKRIDLGKSRTVSKECADAIIELKERMPHITR